MQQPLDFLGKTEQDKMYYHQAMKSRYRKKFINSMEGILEITTT